MIHHYLFTIAFLLFDFLLNILGQTDFALTVSIFIPCTSLVAFVLSTKELSVYDAIKFSLFYGLFSSLFIPNNLWIQMVCLLLVSLFVRIWAMNISDSFLELLILSIVMIFIFQSCSFGMNKIKGLTSISYLFWAYRYLLKTIIYNIPLAALVIYLHNLMDEIIMERMVEKARNEELFWHKLKNRS